jgi:transposase-like protein
MLQDMSQQMGIVPIHVHYARTMGTTVMPRTNVSLNNRIAQDHRGITQRPYPIRGFGTVVSAARLGRAAGRMTPVFPSSPLRKGNDATIATAATLP